MAEGDPLSNVPPDEFVKARDALREAMRSQRDAMHRLLDEAEQVAAGAGLALTLEQQRRIQDTLETAASTDPDALREGRLQRELSPAGFDALLSGPQVIAPKAGPKAVEPKAGVAALASRAATRKQAFEARAREQKRLAQERRDRMLLQREIQRAQLVAQRLAGRAEQLEKLAERTRDAAEKARSKADETRRAANESAARLIELRTKPDL